MTTDHRRTIYTHALTPQTQLCTNCRHYYTHYTARGEPLSSGHCVTPRIKLRYAYDTCRHFENKHTGHKPKDEGKE